MDSYQSPADIETADNGPATYKDVGFLCLPAEVRNIIYGYLQNGSEPIIPLPVKRQYTVIERPFTAIVIFAGISRSIPRPAGIPNLAYTNQKIFCEVVSFFIWHGTVSLYDSESTEDMVTFFARIPLATGYHALRKVSIGNRKRCDADRDVSFISDALSICDQAPNLEILHITIGLHGFNEEETRDQAPIGLESAREILRINGPVATEETVRRYQLKRLFNLRALTKVVIHAKNPGMPNCVWPAWVSLEQWLRLCFELAFPQCKVEVENSSDCITIDIAHD